MKKEEMIKELRNKVTKAEDVDKCIKMLTQLMEHHDIGTGYYEDEIVQAIDFLKDLDEAATELDREMLKTLEGDTSEECKTPYILRREGTDNTFAYLTGNQTSRKPLTKKQIKKIKKIRGY